MSLVSEYYLVKETTHLFYLAPAYSRNKIVLQCRKSFPSKITVNSSRLSMKSIKLSYDPAFQHVSSVSLEVFNLECYSGGQETDIVPCI